MVNARVCSICTKSEIETDLYEGIYEGRIVLVCTMCAEEEKIPLIKKPTQEQISGSEGNISVRERMEKLSEKERQEQGKIKLHILSRDQTIANKNLAKLKFPEKRQEPESLIENYYWKIQSARRNKKITISQLSQKTSIPEEIIQNLEKGQLPKNFEAILTLLEEFFDIKLIKRERKEVTHINEKTKQPIKIPQLEKSEQTFQKEQQSKEQAQKKQKFIEKLEKGKIDFSKREHLQDITLSDLTELQKQKQKQDMFGDDLDLEADTKEEATENTEQEKNN